MMETCKNCNLILLKKNQSKQTTQLANNPRTNLIVSGLNNSTNYIYVLERKTSVEKFSAHGRVFNYSGEKKSLNQAIILEK